MTLVAWYRCNDSDGITAVDSSGNDYNGTGTYTSAVGKIGKAASFNGSTDTVTLAGLTIANNAPFTFSSWYYLRSWANGFPSLISLKDSAGIRMLEIFLTNSVNYAGCSFGAAGTSWVKRKSDVIPAFNVWTHYLLTYNGNGGTTAENFNLYNNGILTPTTNIVSAFSNTLNASYISPVVNAWTAFDGLIDDIRIYNTALTQEQIKSIYNNGAGTDIAYPWESENFSNLAQTTLASDIDNSITSLTVNDGSKFPPTNFRILINNELIKVAIRLNNVFSGLTRSCETGSSIAASHVSGTKVTHVVTTESLTELTSQNTPRNIVFGINNIFTVQTASSLSNPIQILKTSTLSTGCGIVLTAPTGSAAVFKVCKNTLAYDANDLVASFSVAATTGVVTYTAGTVTANLSFIEGDYLTFFCESVGSTIAGAGGNFTLTLQKNRP